MLADVITDEDLRRRNRRVARGLTVALLTLYGLALVGIVVLN